MRSKIFRLYQRWKKIRKRYKIAEQWGLFWRGYKSKHPYEGKENRLHKFNLNCGCRVCRHRKPKTKNDGLPTRDIKRLPADTIESFYD